MRIIKGLIIAFSMYSRIPMPHFKWDEDDMRYMLCFFPWVGAVIGTLVWAWKLFCDMHGVNLLCYTLIGMAVPVMITGGMHIDGYMDTMDAFRSYRPAEKKLEIMKDPHIGAFAVIMLALYGSIYAGAYSAISDNKLVGIFAVSFVLARSLSGIAVVTFKPAKAEGMLFECAGSSHQRAVLCSLIIQALACTGIMIWLDPMAGITAVCVSLLSFFWYHHNCYKNIGGITGDTAGYFVLMCEEAVLVALMIINILES